MAQDLPELLANLAMQLCDISQEMITRLDRLEVQQAQMIIRLDRLEAGQTQSQIGG